MEKLLQIGISVFLGTFTLLTFQSWGQVYGSMIEKSNIVAIEKFLMGSPSTQLGPTYVIPTIDRENNESAHLREPSGEALRLADVLSKQGNFHNPVLKQSYMILAQGQYCEYSDYNTLGDVLSGLELRLLNVNRANPRPIHGPLL